MKWYLITGETALDMIESVNIRLADGWELKGEIVFCQSQSSPDRLHSSEQSYHHPAFFTQAMTKE